MGVEVPPSDKLQYEPTLVHATIHIRLNATFNKIYDNNLFDTLRPKLESISINQWVQRPFRCLLTASRNCLLLLQGTHLPNFIALID